MSSSREITEQRPSLLFTQGESAVEFINNNLKPSHLKECTCCNHFIRANGDVRQFIDELAVQIFDSQGWPRETPIQVSDVAAGGLLQLATVVTSLVNAGYKVAISIIDMDFSSNELPKNAPHEKTAALKDFEKLLAILNKKTKPGTAVLNGVFSHVDSYLATIQGKAPLQYERISASEISSRVGNGEKRRYLQLDLRTEDEKKKGVSALLAKDFDRNEQYAKEFKQNCKKCYPDLVLTVDDISNFFPTGIIDWSMGDKDETKEQKYIKQQYMTSNNNDYAYKNEVVDPIQKLNSRAIFIGTLKKEDPEQLELHITHQQGKETLHVSNQEQPDPSQLLASLKTQQVRMPLNNNTSKPESFEMKLEEIKKEHPKKSAKPHGETFSKTKKLRRARQEEQITPDKTQQQRQSEQYQKIIALRQECQNYYNHLTQAIAKEDAKTKPNAQARTLAISKRQGITTMYRALVTDEPLDTQLRNFNTLFDQLKPHFELRRDSTEVALLNKIVKILASAAIYLFGLWKTEGGKTLDRMKAIQETDSDPAPTPAKNAQPKSPSH